MAKIVARKNGRRGAWRGALFDEPQSVVYFVGSDANELVKVGYSNDFRKRFIALSATCPVQLIVYGIMKFKDDEAAKKAERSIHMMLTKGGRHSHGEWFKLPRTGITVLAMKFASLGVEVVGFDQEPVTSATTEDERPSPPFHINSARPRGIHAFGRVI